MLQSDLTGGENGQTGLQVEQEEKNILGDFFFLIHSLEAVCVVSIGICICGEIIQVRGSSLEPAPGERNASFLLLEMEYDSLFPFTPRLSIKEASDLADGTAFCLQVFFYVGTKPAQPGSG